MRVRVRTRSLPPQDDLFDPPVRIRTRTPEVRVRKRTKPEPEDGIKYWAYHFQTKSKAWYAGCDGQSLLYATSEAHARACHTKMLGFRIVVSLTKSEQWYSYEELKEHKLTYWEAHPSHREAHEEYLTAAGKTIWEVYPNA